MDKKLKEVIDALKAENDPRNESKIRLASGFDNVQQLQAYMTMMKKVDRSYTGMSGDEGEARTQRNTKGDIRKALKIIKSGPITTERMRKAEGAMGLTSWYSKWADKELGNPYAEFLAGGDI